MTDLTTLAARVEAGTADKQRELLYDAWDALGPMRRLPLEQAGDFATFVDYGAYVDAAMMLVPEGWEWMAGHGRVGAIDYVHNGELAFVGIGARPNPAQRWYECRAATPALALAAAALRAHASEAAHG